MTDRRRVLTLMVGFAAAPLQAAVAAEPLKIAVVDTGNTGRSLMAETLLRDLIRRRGLHVSVISRGLEVDPFDEAPEANAAILMRQRGFDVATHRARGLTPTDIKFADLILTMTAKHAETVAAAYPQAQPRTFTLSLYATGTATDVPDAWGKPMADYQAVLAQLDRYLPLALEKAVTEARSRTGT
jgi:protein-tyrosine phosphatase